MSSLAEKGQLTFSEQPTVAERLPVHEPPLVHPSGGHRITGKSKLVDGQPAEPPAKRKRTRSEEDSFRQNLLNETKNEEFEDVCWTARVLRFLPKRNHVSSGYSVAT